MTFAISLAALAVSIVALVLSAVAASRQIRLARHANAVPVLVDLFREHRGDRLAAARQFVYASRGYFEREKPRLADLDEDKYLLVRELMWFYDNLGAIVAHDVVEVEAVSGYLGASVLRCWSALEPLIQSERQRRMLEGDPDGQTWQLYFENLVQLVEETSPAAARASRPNWRLGRQRPTGGLST